MRKWPRQSDRRTGLLRGISISPQTPRWQRPRPRVRSPPNVKMMGLQGAANCQCGRFDGKPGNVAVLLDAAQPISTALTTPKMPDRVGQVSGFGTLSQVIRGYRQFQRVLRRITQLTRRVGKREDAVLGSIVASELPHRQTKHRRTSQSV